MADLHRRLFVFLVIAGWTAFAVPASASWYHCPFCLEERGPTLVGDFNEAMLVMYGHFDNAQLGAQQSDFIIEKVLKSHDVVKGKNSVTVLKVVPGAERKFIVFCDVNGNAINPYRGEEVAPSSELLKYLASAVERKDDPISKRLRHCFDFLDNPDTVVSTDAYREYARADYTDYRDMAKSLPAKTIEDWLKDEKTPTYRLGLYASLLGHCGDAKIHGPFLRSMLEDPKKTINSNVEGIMAGYVMLQPKEALAYMQAIAKEDGREDFYQRYAVIGTLRFFWDTRQDVLTKEQILQCEDLLLNVQDVSDFAIDDLRNWKQWQMTDKILGLFTKPSHEHPVVKRAVLRFALCSPQPAAAEFVAAQRKRDPQWVSDTEDLLRSEMPVEAKDLPKKK